MPSSEIGVAQSGSASRSAMLAFFDAGVQDGKYDHSRQIRICQAIVKIEGGRPAFL
jgi:hypothetical protein